MRQFAGGKIAQGIVDLYPNPPKAQMVHLNKDEIRRVLGMEIPLAECKRLLETLEFKVKQIGDDTLEAVVPDHRLDIQVGPADLIEDLIRLYGYEKLPETRLGEELPDWLDTRSIDFEEEVKDHLVARGLQEVITYALLDPAREKLLGITPREYITLLNPISSERTALRQTLLAGILEIAASNLRQCSSLALFEIGTVYWSIPGQKMPSEPRQLVLVLS
ncbi:MAG: phenylalanine--tRNA ligase subunit beta, partial [Gemmataceae bacterium]